MTTPSFSRQAFEDIASFLPLFGASNFDFGTWVMRQGSFPFVTYHPEVGRFVLALERHGWVHESADFLWGPWLRTPEAQHLMSGETLGRATPEQLARLLTVFARQERIVDGARLQMYHSGLLVAILRRVQDYLFQLPWTAEIDAVPTQSVPMQAPVHAEPMQVGSSLTFADAARRVHEFISQFEEGYFPPLLMLARLTEETGEIARVIAHQNGKKPKRGEEVGDLEMELADLLFVTFCLANERGLSLEHGFNRMMDKIEGRDKDRWTRRRTTPAPAPRVTPPQPVPAMPEPTPELPKPEAPEPEVTATPMPERLPEPPTPQQPTPQPTQIVPAEAVSSEPVPAAPAPTKPLSTPSATAATPEPQPESKPKLEPQSAPTLPEMQMPLVDFILDEVFPTESLLTADEAPRPAEADTPPTNTPIRKRRK